jgi:hypothetical protein
MSPAVQKGPLGDLHANGPSPREERVEGTPRRLTQGATARLGDLALLRSILLKMSKRVTTARNWDEFKRMLNVTFPKKGTNLEFILRSQERPPTEAAFPGFRRPAALAV